MFQAPLKSLGRPRATLFLPVLVALAVAALATHTGVPITRADEATGAAGGRFT